MTDGQITPTEYSPDDELGRLLSEFVGETSLTVHSDQSVGPGQQKSFTVHYREFEVGGTETYGPTAIMASYEGHIGLAACLVLAHAIKLGEPTQCYVDSSDAIDEISKLLGTDEMYQDITAEWYTPPAVKSGAPQQRLNNRVGYDHEMVKMDEIERYARVWLSAGTDE